MSAYTLSITAVLETTGPCPSCGVEFAIPAALKVALRESKANFYCPSGHLQAYRESEADRLKKQLAERERVLAEKERALVYQRERAEKAETKHEASQRKLKRLTKGGVCPCCRRNFSALARHMKTKHPEFEP